ncbi:FGFR1 oncogene partner 2 homolog [Episyrphus balteatus]|uniref:FGFR1 oncogene partner 2 homolog n=1 Tax=Episyrphus balteatus TaxID=286459 RepID=UPI0024851306|nr:FGFR1 oncogene partner 2 homolog [Episyrphus balteatus]
MANITVGQIIVDAQRMASRIKDLEVLSGGLLMEAEGNNRHLEAMRKFQDDLDSLNRITRDKSNADMVNRINVQNPCIRKVREENRELKACLEDHERALELIMHKYREHTQSKVLTSQINFKEMYNENLWKIIREQADKITEMAAVMQRAASIDDEAMYKEIELLTKLKMENQNLREMLQISNKFDSTGKLITPNAHLLEDKAIQTENNAPTTSTSVADHESSALTTCANVANNNNTPISTVADNVVDKIGTTTSVATLESGGNNNVVAIVNTPPSPNAAIDNSIIANSTVATTITAAVSNLEKSLKNTLNMSSTNQQASGDESSRVESQQQQNPEAPPNNPANLPTATSTT